MNISTIKDKVRMEDVLLHYQGEVEYRGWNTWVSMRCPFHSDRAASASVNLSEDRFKCHGCSVSGDILDVVMEVEGITEIGEAIKWIQDNISD